ncbi:uncharacterized protein HRG_01696 [Hirsutella rhossiliensis]|uniref:Protamine P1 n=1 Tax=Hirsutella rhossiliensis TaxID=111463 RepID=A0A9P8N3K1_9HYPO|nr:uncharacterized protein HRG_01696 [Hirsutella rhossiliensis]KAH0966287.1 hypothetical protein HRG_01696 [Hirsutella rhossiliensis]
MAMVPDDPLSPRDLPVYSEAMCDDEPYYQGSEDEDYPDPQTRRLRYEKAGQRFLDGKVPFLLSASLRGPFNEDSGWTNPWRSKQRCEYGRASQFVCESVHGQTTKAPWKQESTADDRDCHLPSPESLKQAPASGSHPYLKRDELAMVQNWRENIHEPSLSQDSFWASSTSETGVTTTKRRATESAWLKRVADKRRRTDADDPRFSNSPFVSSQPDSYSSPVARIHAAVASTALAASKSQGDDIGSARKSLSGHRPQIKHESNDADDDELMTNTPDAAFPSVSRLSASSKKRSPPRQHVWRSAILHVGGVADELSQNEAAAATLSSPVSQRHGTSPNCASNVATKEVPNAFATAKTSPSRRSWRNIKVEAEEECSAMNGNGQRDDEPTMVLDEDWAPFGTQQDQSFCFKMRYALERDAEVLDQALPDEPNQPASPPNLSSQEPLSDMQAAEDRSSHIVDKNGPTEDESDGRDDDETESIPSSDDIDEFHVRFMERYLDGWDQELACGATSQVEQEVVYDDAQEDVAEIAQQAIHAMSPVQSGLECSSLAIESKEEAKTVAQPLPSAISLTSHSHETSSAIEMEHETLVPQPCRKVLLLTHHRRRNPLHAIRWPLRRQSSFPESGAAVDIDGCGSHGGNVSNSQPQPQPRPSTPEPQFAVKTFASFLSPSPGRSRGQRGRPTVRDDEGGGPPSAMKNPWSCSRPVRRVSWALMPQDQGVLGDEQNTQPPEPTPKSLPLRHRLRQVSPPPATPIEDLPVSEQSRFSKHFAAVASRTDGQRHKLIPTASQQALQSPGMQGMARTFLAADEVGPGAETAPAADDVGGSNDEAFDGDGDEADGGSDESEEPMELVEDMLREIADFVKSWDVDAELDEARRATRPEAGRVNLASQSPW